MAGVFCLSVGFAYLSLGVPVQHPTTPADLDIGPPDVDLGTARQYQSLTHRSVVVNRLPVAVTFDHVGKSCSCTSAAITPPRLEPGQSGELAVVWGTGDKAGRVSDRITLIATAEGRPGQLVRHLTVRADVQPDFRLEPAELRFTTEGGTQRIVLKQGTLPEVKLIGAFVAAGGLRVSTDVDAGVVEVVCPAGLAAPAEFAVLVKTTAVSGALCTVPVKVSREKTH